MTDQAQRAAELDRLLRRALDVGADAPAGPCPSPDVLAAYVEGGLDDPERAAFEAHASNCRRCLESLAAIAELAPLPPFAAEPTPSRSRWRSLWPWVAPLTAAATAAVLYLAVRPASVPPSRVALPDVEMAQPAAAENATAPQPAPVAPSIGQSTDKIGSGPPASAESFGRMTDSSPGLSEPPSRPSRGEDGKRESAGRFAPSPDAEAPLPAASPAPPRPAPAIAPPGPPPASPTSDRLAANAAPPPQRPTRPVADQDEATVQAAHDAAVDVAAAPSASGAGGAPAIVGATRPAESLALQEEAESLRKGPPAAAAPMAQAERRGVRERAEAGTSAASAKSVEFAGAVATPRWRVGAGGRIERSDDGGLMWRPQVSGVSADLVAFQAVNATTVWAVGSRGTTLVCTDGETWQKVSAPTDSDLVRVTARDASAAVVVTREGTQYSTSDRGRTWTTMR